MKILGDILFNPEKQENNSVSYASLTGWINKLNSDCTTFANLCIHNIYVSWSGNILFSESSETAPYSGAFTLSLPSFSRDPLNITSFVNILWDSGLKHVEGESENSTESWVMMPVCQGICYQIVNYDNKQNILGIKAGWNSGRVLRLVTGWSAIGMGLDQHYLVNPSKVNFTDTVSNYPRNY